MLSRLTFQNGGKVAMPGKPARRCSVGLVAVAALTVLALALCCTQTALADYEQVGNFATEPQNEGQKIAAATGAAINVGGVGGVEPGSVYISAGYLLENTILRYSPTGKLQEVWGWKTIASGPDLPNQHSSVDVSATAGAYELELNTAKGEVRYTKGSNIVKGMRGEVGSFHIGDAVESFGKLPAGNGTGNLSAGSKTVSSVTGVFEQWEVGMTISGPGVPSGTTVTAVSPEAKMLTLSQAATETGTGVSLRGRVTVAAVGDGTLELSAAAEESTESASGGNSAFNENSITATETTAPIAFDASAKGVEADLLALPAFEAGDVSVSGGPGDAAGTTPYEIAFEGSYVGSPVELSTTESTLTGGFPSSEAAISTTVAASTPGFQRCRLYFGDRCTAKSPLGEEGTGEFRQPQGVAVDQATGDVYVLNNENHHDLIEVFSADGSEVIARFGDLAASSGTPTSEEPEKLHHFGGSSIAVDESGTVYVGDGGIPLRVMCFRPESLGDYNHYEYCGASHDIAGVPGAQLAFDDAGHLYGAEEKLLQERSSAEAGAPILCSVVPVGRIFAMAVNPHTGEVFYFDGSPTGKKVHRLKPCVPQVGKFEESQAPVAISPSTKEVKAFAFNPDFGWGVGRPQGVLYAAGSERAGNVEVESVKYYGFGYLFAPANTHAPEVLGESVSGALTGSAVLHARIDPYGHPTGYAFQYESEAQYQANEPGERFAGAGEVPIGGGTVSGTSGRQVAVTLTGLSPDTAYRFRVVASSFCDAEHPAESCVADGEILSFATYPLFSPGLPDHRVYELVSPAQKNGGEVIPVQPEVGSCASVCKPAGLTDQVAPVQGAPNGEALAYMGQPFSPLEGTAGVDSYVSRRGASGWQTTAQLPALPTGVKQLAFDASLERGLLGTVDQSELKLQDTAQPGLTTSLVSATNHRVAGELELSYGGHSADFSRLFFSANDSLTSETPVAPEPPDPGASGRDLYEWHGGRLALVNVLPGNATISSSPAFVSVSPDVHGVSTDGTRVFWQAGGKLYVRVDGSQTLEVAEGEFLTANPEGTKVLLKSGKLFGLNGVGTSYEEAADLTEGQGGFLGVVGASEGLSKIYFADKAAFATAPEAGTCSPGTGVQHDKEEEGKVPSGLGCNLYLYEEGAPTRFIATLNPTDGTGSKGLQDWSASPAGRTAEASLDGRYLAFGSTVRLTGYDNWGPCGRATPNAGEWFIVESACREAFLYDSSTGRLACASCDPTGEPPLGVTTLRAVNGDEFPQPRYLTDEGRLYFDSGDSLSSRDTNEGVEDVYEYEPQGAGSEGACRRQAGCVFLISAGTGSSDSNLIAVDKTGKNVFFDTRDRLSLRDKDELLDVYDAREGGGFSGESEVANVECQGEACQTSPQSPVFSTPASTTFSGAGNPIVSPPATGVAKPKNTGKRVAGGKLAGELRACRHKRSKRKRAACERRARKLAKKASARDAAGSSHTRVGGYRGVK